ncbi:MAG TPA: NAD(P)H-binding protein [Thermoanaerobaculia bacterium]|nr:NAD(P)H-binding protein [Thermoanaerobaculia bacterium]
MNLFLTGSTGYIARALIPELLLRGHTVRALIRPGSERKLVNGARPVIGNALDASTFARYVAPSDTFIHLVGVAHPSPAKAEEFRTIDLVSIQQSVLAAKGSSIAHFIYLSVAHPAPAMKAYVAVRQEGERLLRESAIPSTFVRPWYVLGPGH